MADSKANEPSASPGARIQPGIGMLWRICVARVDTLGHAYAVGVPFVIKLINSSSMPIEDLRDVFNGGELSVTTRADRQLLNRVWPMADRGEHLGARQHELHRSLRDPGGKSREWHMRPDTQPCTESTADERHQYTHAGWINAERGRQRIAHGMRILRGVMDGQRIAVPHRHRSKQADRIVRVLRSRVGLR